MNKFHLKKGFTLIELLVVISIMAILSSIVLTSLASAREKARVSELVQNLKQFQIALEVYKEATGKYPYEDSPSDPFMYSVGGGGDEITANLVNIPNQPSFIPDFIASAPKPLSFSSPFLTHGQDYIQFQTDDYTASNSTNDTCGDKRVSDSKYLIYYIDDSYIPATSDLPLPKYSVNGEVQPSVYCLVSN